LNRSRNHFVAWTRLALNSNHLVAPTHLSLIRNRNHFVARH